MKKTLTFLSFLVLGTAIAATNTVAKPSTEPVKQELKLAKKKQHKKTVNKKVAKTQHKY